MKRIVKYFSLIATMLVSFFSFAGCELFNGDKNNNVTQLTTPIAPAVNFVNGEIIVSTFEVNNASSYQLLINGIPYNSVTPSFNCTNYINNAGEYTLKIVALGVGEYSNSKYSAETTYTYKKQIETPRLILDNKTISWSALTGANQYEVFVNEQSVLSTTETSLSLESEELSNSLSEVGNYLISVKAKENGYYTESLISNSVSYKVTKQISAPTSVEIVKRENVYKLKWAEVSQAESYNVYINGSKLRLEEPLTNPELDVTQYITQAKDYYFNVQAYIENEFLIPSNFSQEYVYRNIVQLEKPQVTSSLSDDSVHLTWNSVSNAQTYSVYINGEKYNRSIFQTQEVVNAVISKNYLSAFEKPLNFKVIANGYDNYLASEYSNTVIVVNYGKLEAPTNIQVSKIDSLVEVTFNAVDNAETYSVLINETSLKTTSSTKVDISELITEPKIYQIKVKSNATSKFEESDYSAVIEFSNTGKLTAPTGVKMVLENDELKIDWNNVENALSYNLTIIHDNGTTQSSYEIPGLSESNYTYKIAEAGLYKCYVVAVGNDSYNSSPQSDQAKVEYRTTLKSPTGVKVSVNENNLATITWNSVAEAASYIVYVSCGSKQISFNNNETSMIYDLSTQEDGIYIFNVMAIASQNSYYTNSELSVSVSYIYGNPGNMGSTYYYRGEEQDFNITSQEELNHILSYVTLYKITEIELEILFDYSANLEDKYFFTNLLGKHTDYAKADATIRNEVITALNSYNNDIDSYESFEVSQVENSTFKFNFTYFNSTGEPSIEPTQEKQPESTVNPPLTVEQRGYEKRSGTFDAFYIETLLNTYDVLTSNQLAELLSFSNKQEGNKKPNFIIANGNAEKVYNEAKEVLRQVVVNEMSDFEKVTAIFEWLVYNVTFDNQVLNDTEVQAYNHNSYYAEGVFYNKIAVSDGFAKAFSILCGIEGIETRIIVGELNGNRHVWNKVKINNEWYVVDASTSSVSNESGERMVAHFKNFLKADSQLTGYKEQTIEVPVAENSINYYDEMDLVGTYDLFIENTDEATAIINLLILERNVTSIEIQYVEDLDFLSIYMQIVGAGLTFNGEMFDEGTNHYAYLYVL